MKISLPLFPKLKTLIILITIHCSLFTIHCQAQQGEWTWMNGSSSPNQAAVYGHQGVFVATNTPVALEEPCQWTDLNGNFWMFGGIDLGNSYYQVLWEFKPAIDQWAWIGGDTLLNQDGIYGTQGVPSVSNIPGSRNKGVATWVDTAGDLWLFGGNGIGDYSGNYGVLNDLWRYHIATNEWTWMSGADTANDPGSYGTILVPNATNLPPARGYTDAAWSDANNVLWLFGGANIGLHTYSDLWNYNISTNLWTWMKGPDIVNQPATYGTLGVPNAANNPSSRMAYSKWKDNGGNFYLFGGVRGFNVYENDMWRYSPLTNEWTWMNGGNADNDTSLSNGLCTTTPTNIPGARYDNSASWTRRCDNFVFFGGSGEPGSFNDLWNYGVVSNEWTLINGSTAAGGAGSWGTELLSAPANIPSSRDGAVGWTDTLGNLWLFGGGYSASFYNDMWVFVPDTTCPHVSTDNAVSSFIPSPLNGCGNLTINFQNTSTNGASYFWNFGDSTTSVSIDASHSYPAAGRYVVTLIAYPGCGGPPDTTSDTIQVHLLPTPNITSTGPDTFCLGSADTLNPGNYSSYSWNTTATTQSIIANTTGDYVVTVTDTNGCTATTSYNIVVLTPVIPIAGFFSNITTGCSPLTVQFTNVSSAGTYFWNFGDGSTDTATNPTHTFTNIDTNVFTIYLVIKDSGRCGVAVDTAFDINGIQLNAEHPVALFTSNYLAPIFTGDSIHFEDESYDLFTSITYWQWYFGDGDSSHFINPIHEWNLPGSYKVELSITDKFGCVDSTFFKYIDVIEGLINIPNTFTPNNDGFNDYFEITTSGMEIYDLEIFNRWGVREFQTNGNHLFWDGYDQSGRQCPDGTYFYTLKAVGYSGTNFSRSGFIMLIR